jgi:hypothetical protein
MSSIRDFWDTVVLRDVLGYIVPGAVTLVALALLLLPLLVLPFGGRAPHFVIASVLPRLLASHKPWISAYPWVVAAIIIPLCFVIGHVQGQIVACLGRHWVPDWNLGHVALDSLREEMKRGGDYIDVALRELHGMHGAVDLVARCAEKRGRFRELCCYLKPFRWQRAEEERARQAQSTRKEPKGKCEQEAEKQARDLWYLCNHYVLNESPHLHAMWIGRYYVLTILFSNLFLSFVLLTAGLVLLWFWGCLALLNTIVSVGACTGDLLAILLPLKLLVGWNLMVRISCLAMCAVLVCSCQFRRAYVERTFPIFCVLVRSHRQACQHQGRQTPEGGATPPRRPWAPFSALATPRRRRIVSPSGETGPSSETMHRRLGVWSAPLRETR